MLWSHLGRRLLALLPVLFGISVIVFSVLHLTPGDPAELLAGPTASAEVLAGIREHYGLDKPLVVQYAVWLKNVLRGDLGTSLFTQRPVAREIADKFQATALLAMMALLLCTAVGLPLGVVAAVRKGSLWDRGSMLAALAGVSMPSFALGLMLIILFAGKLRWFPAQGMTSPIGGGAGDVLLHLVLPGITLAVQALAIIARLTRSSLLEILHQDYVRTARAKGVSTAGVYWRHALRNALIPVVTIIGAQAGYFLGGSVLVEYVFGWPGLGNLTIAAIGARDYPLVQGATLLLATIFVLVNLLVDLSYAYLDPRIRYA